MNHGTSVPSAGFRRSLALVVAAVAMLNIGAWVCACIVFRGQPVLLGVAVAVYGLGLRHALDADHIAAIDNVTRKLLHDGRRSAATGFWFAIGHSAVILIATVLAISIAGSLGLFEAFNQTGRVVSTLVSGLFLLLVAVMNACVLFGIVRTILRLRAGHPMDRFDVGQLGTGGGLYARLYRRLFQQIGQPWQMALLGFLFGLSFDTASEVALFGLAATQSANGAPLASALVYPGLFAAGMVLLDTVDGIIMVGVYHRAVADPLRRLRYNLLVTFISIGIALFIACLNLASLAAGWFPDQGVIARVISALNDDLNVLGIAIVALFILAWFASVATSRLIARHAPLALDGSGAGRS